MGIAPLGGSSKVTQAIAFFTLLGTVAGAKAFETRALDAVEGLVDPSTAAYPGL